MHDEESLEARSMIAMYIKNEVNLTKRRLKKRYPVFTFLFAIFMLLDYIDMKAITPNPKPLNQQVQTELVPSGSKDDVYLDFTQGNPSFYTFAHANGFGVDRLNDEGSKSFAMMKAYARFLVKVFVVPDTEPHRFKLQEDYPNIENVKFVPLIKFTNDDTEETNTNRTQSVVSGRHSARHTASQDARKQMQEKVRARIAGSSDPFELERLYSVYERDHAWDTLAAGTGIYGYAKHDLLNSH